MTGRKKSRPGPRHGGTSESACACREDPCSSSASAQDCACCACHDHSHAHGGSGEEGRGASRLRLIVSGLLLALAFLPGLPGPLSFLLGAAAYLLAGWDVLLRAGRNLAAGRVFDENFLMSLASLGAFFIGQRAEAAAVMLFYQVGELFQGYAVDRSRRSVRELMDLRPDRAFRIVDGRPVETNPEDIAVGDLILVHPGEKIPLDGDVLEGESWLDTSALTGESEPRPANPGSPVLSGFLNQSGVLKVRVQKTYGDSTASRILRLVEDSAENKAVPEQFITKFAGIYTPAVVAVAIILALLLPPLAGIGWAEGLHRALIFLVVSCPCALVISVPMGYFAGIGRASRAGVLVKGGNYLEALCHAEIAVFDKTGTLTRGKFRVVKLAPVSVSDKELLEYAALVESLSSHPVARSIREAWGGSADTTRISEYTELPGKGVRARVDGQSVWAGTRILMEDLGLSVPGDDPGETVVHVAKGGAYLGGVFLRDTLKKDTAEALRALKSAGVRKTVMLTGDREEVAARIGKEAGIDEVVSGLLPIDKVSRIEVLLKETSPGRTLLYAGDGINDAPALRRADVGVAMGALGSDAAMEAADVVIMTDELSSLVSAMKIARSTRRIVQENIAFAISVKLLVLVMGALGLAGMWQAVFADVGVSLLAVANAMRLLRFRVNE
ncbi:heavy metal translocating P-type ATPase [Papillibacter cinnamivorans]|uniref:Cd(2+)-exporting ATPase n=1 Tax=Papillibacter cinnamivorans DSM 12816 TaxID=1122930 RepID=A0A1W1ZPW7_9FIRM|nr:heavy metal translocating P-type ATPase [Papillibacter cinnamivorans]SMC50407.1 Cd2+/Zn2+-exporting ATPase [Papillibacter cinnamivorans DSM 12816]